ncbi:MAG TPA: aquaporin [bacterium]|jgi:aquaporin NIP|nr:aquaporin [bacterium]
MKKKSGLIRPAVAEAIGTFALVFAGCGAIMVSQRFPGTVAPGSIPLVFGLVIGVMIYAVGHISGAHFNPAVTLGLATAGRFPKKHVPAYWGAQFLGALAAVALLDAILPSGSGFGATVPSVGPGAALAWEAVLTFFLVFVIISVATDKRAPGAMAGVAIGGTICLDAFLGGSVTGASMNPARSLAPALFEGTLPTVWIYVAGPALGAVAAALSYEWLRGSGSETSL